MLLIQTKFQVGNEDAYVVHELLHALSISFRENKTDNSILVKGGIEYRLNEKNEGGFTCTTNKMRAINEGMTQALAERCTRTITGGSYDTIKDIYKIISIIVGEETMLKKYFSNITEEDDFSEFIFKKDLERKYGKEFGQEITDALIEVCSISENLTNSLEDLSKEKAKMQEKVYTILESMLDKIMESEQDIRTKINDIMIPSFSTPFGRKYYKKIMEEFSEDKSLQSEEKKDIAHHIIDQYMELAPYAKQGLDGNFIIDLYMGSGIISENKWNKKAVLLNLIKGSCGIKFNSKLEQIKYYQVGDYYMILGDYRDTGDNHEVINGKMFDKDGSEVSETVLEGEENQAKIDKILKLLPPKNRQKVRISKIGDLLKIKYSLDEKDDSDHYEFYCLDSNSGTLKRVDSGALRNFTDDMEITQIMNRMKNKNGGDSYGEEDDERF